MSVCQVAAAARVPCRLHSLPLLLLLLLLLLRLPSCWSSGHLPDRLNHVA